MKKKDKEFVFCKNCHTLIEKGKKCPTCGCDEYDEYLSLDLKDIDYPRYSTLDVADWFSGLNTNDIINAWESISNTNWNSISTTKDINTWDTISNTNWNSISTTLNSISNAMKKLKDYSI